MKKLMTIVLAVSFAIGAASMLVAQDGKSAPTTETEKGKGKGKGGKGGDKGKAPADEKGKAPADEKGKTK